METKQVLVHTSLSTNIYCDFSWTLPRATENAVVGQMWPADRKLFIPDFMTLLLKAVWNLKKFDVRF